MMYSRSASGSGVSADNFARSASREMGAAIITKDEDFAIRISVVPTGPAIVWLRIGNTSTQALLKWFAPLLPRIESALAAGEKIVEVA